MASGLTIAQTGFALAYNGNAVQLPFSTSPLATAYVFMIALTTTGGLIGSKIGNTTLAAVASDFIGPKIPTIANNILSFKICNTTSLATVAGIGLSSGVAVVIADAFNARLIHPRLGAVYSISMATFSSTTYAGLGALVGGNIGAVTGGMLLGCLSIYFLQQVLN